MFTEVLKKTGLTQVELAELFGVSRITVNAWLRGRFAPHPLHKDKIHTMIQQIEAAVDKGQLPLPAGIPKHQRISAAQTAIQAD